MITHTIATIEDFFNHGRFFDGHETNQDMWHTKVSESPSEIAEDVLPACIENTAAECTLCHSSCGCISIFIYSGKESGFAVIQIRIDRWQKAGNDCSGKQYPHVLQW